jgi:hypothetical protein
MTYDFNSAELQASFDIIPAGTIVALEMAIRAGGTGDGGWLRPSRDGQSYMLDCEFTVLDGPHAGRKVWSNLTIEGQSDGHKKAAAISRSRLRAIIESAFGLKPMDSNERAMAMRRIAGFDAFQGLRFMAKLGIEPARDSYAARNTIAAVITPDQPQWRSVPQTLGPQTLGFTQPAAVPNTGRPSWAA